MTTNTISADPADFTVEHIRLRSHGLLSGLVISQRDEPRARFEFDDGDLDQLLRKAREMADMDPHDIRLPSDRALVIACLWNLGIDVPAHLR